MTTFRKLAMLGVLIGATACASSGADGSPTIEQRLVNWIPNRVMDLFDVARAGIDVGPGLGFDLTATENLEAAAVMRHSAGIGLETLRQSPLKDISKEKRAVWGEKLVEELTENSWYRSPTDLRVEAHGVLVGAHAAVDLKELLDFFAGLFLMDVSEDDELFW